MNPRRMRLPAPRTRDALRAVPTPARAADLANVRRVILPMVISFFAGGGRTQRFTAKRRRPSSWPGRCYVGRLPRAVLPDQRACRGTIIAKRAATAANQLPAAVHGVQV